MWASDDFLAGKRKAQNTILEAIYAYWTCRRPGEFGHDGRYWKPLIIKFDDGTQLGKRIGEYDPQLGLELK